MTIHTCRYVQDSEESTALPARFTLRAHTANLVAEIQIEPPSVFQHISMNEGGLYLICWLIEKCDEPKDLCAGP